MTSPPVPPPGTFVLRRPEYLERQARQSLAVLMITHAAGLLVFVVMAVRVFVSALSGSPYLFIGAAAAAAVAGVLLWSLRAVLKWRRVERGLRGMELWIAPEGLTYVTVAGVFPASWSALRGMYFGARPGGRPGAPALFVEVDGWGGPLAEYATDGKPCSLRMPLAGLGVDRPTIARAVHELSAGRVTVAPG